jgi:UDP-glucose 4-epimerase
MTHKCALVTGGAGFIGSHIVDALIARGMRVVVIDDLSTGNKKNVNPKAEFLRLSVASPAFPRVLKRIAPDVVFHTAAQVNVRTSVLDPLTDAKVNVLGTLALVQTAAEAGVKKIIFSSSGGAMFSDAVRPPYTEDMPPMPVSPYGISKLAGERYLAFAEEAYGIETVSLRYANVYGPRQNAKGEAGVIAIFANNLLKNLPITINGDGKQTRDFVYVGDVVRANLLALGKQASGVYHVGTGKETSVNELFRTMKSLVGSKMAAKRGKAQPGEVRRSALTATRAKRELNWEPETSLEAGLEATLASFS